VRRRRAAALLAALSLTAGGCGDNGGGGGGGGDDKTLTIYVSAPLHGERATEGRAIVDGARLALAEAGGRVGGVGVKAVYLDDTRGGGWSIARTAENARRAAEDASAIGYIGDVDSGATRVSLPITNQAEMVQISPASTAVDLTQIPPVGDLEPDDYQPSDRRTFARLVPDDEVQARAAAVWAKRMGARRVLVAYDGFPFAGVLRRAFVAEASRLGIDIARSPGTADEVYFAGYASNATKALSRSFGVPVISSDELLTRGFLARHPTLHDRLHLTSPFIDPSRLSPQGRRFVRRYEEGFHRLAEPAAAYGYEAMALLLDAIRRAGADGDQRDAVIDEVLATRDRRSVIGAYSIDGNGDTTLEEISGYRIDRGRPVFAIELRPRP
jgi:branched-chain amino acid transport system substrate-binding protein